MADPAPGAAHAAAFTSHPQLAFNRRWAKPGPYTTQLPADQETAFQAWVRANSVPWSDSPAADYDMRGFYRALQAGDPQATQAQDPNDGAMHFPDTWKTPYHATFSRESQYALPSAPRWDNNALVDQRTGVPIFTDRAQVHWDDKGRLLDGPWPEDR